MNTILEVKEYFEKQGLFQYNFWSSLSNKHPEYLKLILSPEDIERVISKSRKITNIFESLSYENYSSLKYTQECLDLIDIVKRILITSLENIGLLIIDFVPSNQQGSTIMLKISK